MNEKNQLVHIQGENSYNYTAISNFMNTNKYIVNVHKYLKVNLNYNEEATTLIQITSGDTMRVTVWKSDSTQNKIVKFFFLLDRVELNIQLE